MDLLRIDNYNYNFQRFLSDVNQLLELYGDELGDAVQRTALSEDQVFATLHALTEIAFVPRHGQDVDLTCLEYSSLKLLKERVSREELFTRFRLLPQGKFKIKNREFSVNQAPGFNDTHKPSAVEPTRWPGRLFEISGTGLQLASGPLLQDELPPFDSQYSAIAKFMEIKPFRNAANSCRGQIELFIPTLLVRIHKLSLAEKRLTVTVESKLPFDQLRYKVCVASEQEQHSLTETPKAEETQIDLPFDPAEISIWIISARYGLLDRYLENQHWNVGNRPFLLPKAVEAEPATIPTEFLSNGFDVADTGASARVRDTARLVVTLMDGINNLFQQKYRFKLFQVHEQRALLNIADACSGEDEFNARVQVLGSLIDWMNVHIATEPISGSPESGSLNLLETFLAKQYPNCDKKIVGNLRRIKAIRKGYPTHRDTAHVIDAFKELGLSYPVKHWDVAWLRVLDSYLDSLKLLGDLLQPQD